MKQKKNAIRVAIGMMILMLAVPTMAMAERLAIVDGRSETVIIAEGEVPAKPEEKPKPEEAKDDCVDTALFGKVCGTGEGKPIQMLLDIVLKVMLYGVGALATIGFIVAGLQYALAKDDPGKVAAAKQRLMNTVIGLVAYGFLYTVLNWLIPGGI